MEPKKKALTPWWVFALIAVLLGLFFITAFGGGVISRSKPSGVRVENPIDSECSGCRVRVTGYEVTGHSDPRLYIYWQFENNNTENVTRTFSGLVYQEAYQDNVQLDTCYVPNDAGKDATTNIRPGASITVCTGFILRNVQSDVEVSARTTNLLFSEDLGTMTFHFS